MPYKNREKRLAHQKIMYANRQKEHSEYYKARYINEVDFRERCHQRYLRDMEEANNYKKSMGCAICGYNRCGQSLHFHHLRDKSFKVQIRALLNKAINKHKEEKTKCVLLCANCHGEVHAGLLECNGEVTPPQITQGG